ncbi:hypothetical protein [Paeniglutamicibacter terrestris]|uniref:Uncharacterized protein n=1 Tax=Paeniglutamicibacter terrestris TaxID=2723403 RepID=A0ABX1G9J4_9MICC|nr:hypothetical protein [Paeniglutamicibacter terrestris]NKG22241.1 hypothetical protein [Paeniglutamicibacter terrestris]
MSNNVEATFHPHPSYTAMEAAWDPVRRTAYPGTLAALNPPDRPNDAWAKSDLPPKPTYPIGNLATQKRNKK